MSASFIDGRTIAITVEMIEQYGSANHAIVIQQIHWMTHYDSGATTETDDAGAVWLRMTRDGLSTITGLGVTQLKHVVAKLRDDRHIRTEQRHRNRSDHANWVTLTPVDNHRANPTDGADHRANPTDRSGESDRSSSGESDRSLPYRRSRKELDGARPHSSCGQLSSIGAGSQPAYDVDTYPDHSMPEHIPPR